MRTTEKARQNFDVARIGSRNARLGSVENNPGYRIGICTALDGVIEGLKHITTVLRQIYVKLEKIERQLQTGGR